MRIAFIGGFGHHYLRQAVIEASQGQFEVAVSGDGYDATAPRPLAEKLKAQWFETPTELFDQFQPDVVSIGAIYAHNGEIAAQALERDIKVVCDKPVAANWNQLEHLRALTENSSRLLLTEFPFRAQREFRAARQAVVEGRIGQVVLATAQKSYRFGASRPAWYGQRDEYTGTMLWIASHGIDVVRFCTRLDFGRVIGIQGNLSHPEYLQMEDHCVALFELANGGSAVVHADYLRPSSAPTHGDDCLRIAGSLGVVEVRNGCCHLIAGDEGETDITEILSVRPPHQELLATVMGEGQGYYSTTESLAVAEILLKARDAADKRQWVAF